MQWREDAQVDSLGEGMGFGKRQVHTAFSCQKYGVGFERATRVEVQILPRPIARD
jgi:hypothetical protein